MFFWDRVSAALTTHLWVRHPAGHLRCSFWEHTWLLFCTAAAGSQKNTVQWSCTSNQGPRWPCTALSRPASPPSYLPSLSKLWKSPADLQPSCHSENVTCRTKCSVASQMALNLPACSCLYYHWKQVALAECSSSIGGCIGKKFIKNLKIDP